MLEPKLEHTLLRKSFSGFVLTVKARILLQPTVNSLPTVTPKEVSPWKNLKCTYGLQQEDVEPHICGFLPG